MTNEYNKETGALEKQSATIKSATKTITSKDNTLGQLAEYTDAEGNVAKYVYEEGSDGRLLEVSEGKGKEAENKQTYSYNATTGLMEKLVDSAAGTFTATYDVEGKMLTDGYPNGMTATDTYNQVGAAIGIEYVKNTDCATKCPETWFSDTVVPSIHGETLVQTSTLAKELYTYDKAGRLTETQETPTGKNCTTRVYSYDEESNRIGLTSREAGSSECTSEDGVVQAHSYDSANQLIDSGVEYETFGNATKLPAIDAGEHALTNTYYVDNQVASQKQNEETIKYLYDPAGRAMETVSEGKTGSTVISHYAGSGNSPTWTSEGSEKWTRNIPGIGGELAAIQTSGGATVLQLHDLQGNIVGTAALSEAETKLLSSYNSTEFGVPQPGTTPPKYAWLGAAGVWSEPSLSSGVSTQGGGSYVPQIARNLQTFPVIPPGSFPNGYGLGAPHTAVVSAASMASAEAESAKIVSEVDAERQKAKEEEAAAILQQCREEGGCGAEGEEEGSYGGEEELIIVGEGSAHSASAGTIECISDVQDPHKSTHAGLKGRNEVNIVATLKCTSSNVGLYIRVALFYEGGSVNQGENTEYGSSSLSANAHATCRTGWYQGWAEFQGEGEINIDRVLKWGKRRYIKC